MLERGMFYNRFDGANACFRPLPFRDGDGAIERNHGRWIERRQQVVKPDNLSPIGQVVSRCCRVTGCNRRLQMVIGELLPCGAALEMFVAEIDEPAIPER